MTENYSDAAASAMENLRKQMSMIAQLQQQRAELTASASVRDNRVTVTVNANGVVIATEFASDIGDLSFDEIAAAVTEAVQQAAADVARQSEELVRPLRAERARRPKLSETVEGIPDLESLIPAEPPVLLSAPGSRERVSDDDADAADPVLVFDDVVEIDLRRDAAARDSSVSDSSW
ncbi:YbaB/EbfC family nucleoid-associated protein [Nocardia sp. NBC_00416]|uniref:YbaB/EbfC family nucleoid-associated protein n=1 Tax=Nocardia sp. NBC_00416 TaxID=2975991 RepID=UPI002E1B6E06